MSRDNELPHDIWTAQRAAHQNRVHPWIQDRLDRGHRGVKHPVYDFLFEYYSFRPAHLQRYSPGIKVVLTGAQKQDMDWPGLFHLSEEGAVLPPSAFPPRRLPTLRWGIRFLDSTLHREPVFHCLGLHEWAMVYRADRVRHQHTRLRLSPEEIARFVQSQQLCCTHFDAFRFFTPEAAPRNRHQLDRYSVNQFDQPGCIHANMDLYKWAFHIAPFTTSTVIADAFALARSAREIDMRASPYDLTGLGFAPIKIETRSGREEYIHLQRGLFQQSQPLRAQLLDEYRHIEMLVCEDLSQRHTEGTSQACKSLTLV